MRNMGTFGNRQFVYVCFSTFVCLVALVCCVLRGQRCERVYFPVKSAIFRCAIEKFCHMKCIRLQCMHTLTVLLSIL